MKNMATMVGQTCIAHRKRREFRRNVHFPGEIPVAGGESRFRIEGSFFFRLFNFRYFVIFLAFWIRCKAWVGLVFIAKRQSCWHGCICHVGSDVAWVIIVRGEEITVVTSALGGISGRCPWCSGVMAERAAIVAIMH